MEECPFLHLLFLDIRSVIRGLLAPADEPRTNAHWQDRARLARTCRHLYQEEMRHHRLLHLPPLPWQSLLAAQPWTRVPVLWCHCRGMTQWPVMSYEFLPNVFLLLIRPHWSTSSDYYVKLALFRDSFTVIGRLPIPSSEGPRSTGTEQEYRRYDDCFPLNDASWSAIEETIPLMAVLRTWFGTPRAPL